MMVRTTKQIIEEHLKEWDADNREFVMFNPEEVFEPSELDIKEWVCLSDLKKENAEKFEAIRHNAVTLAKHSYETAYAYLLEVIIKECNSSEQICTMENLSKCSVSGEHAGEGDGSVISQRSSSPVQNHTREVCPKCFACKKCYCRCKNVQKKCTCFPELQEAIPKSWKGHKGTVCGRCGGVL